MSKAIKMTAGQSVFLVETDDSEVLPANLEIPTKSLPGMADGMQPVADLARIGREFAEVRELIVTCCNGLIESMSSLRNPERVAVEFGIKLAGEAGVPMLTKASGEANFKVSVEWKKE